MPSLPQARPLIGFLALFSHYFSAMLLHFFSKALILLDLLLEVTFKDFKAIRNFCKSVVFSNVIFSTIRSERTSQQFS